MRSTFIIDQFFRQRFLYFNKFACRSHIEICLDHITLICIKIKFVIRYLSKDSVQIATNFLSEFRNKTR